MPEAGYRRLDFAAPGLTNLGLVPREPSLPPPTQSGGFPEGAGARTVYPPCQPTHRAAAPGSCIATRPCREPAPHLRGIWRVAEQGTNVMLRVRLI